MNRVASSSGGMNSNQSDPETANVNKNMNNNGGNVNSAENKVEDPLSSQPKFNFNNSRYYKM